MKRPRRWLLSIGSASVGLAGLASSACSKEAGDAAVPATGSATAPTSTIAAPIGSVAVPGVFAEPIPPGSMVPPVDGGAGSVKVGDLATPIDTPDAGPRRIHPPGKIAPPIDWQGH